MSDRFYGPHGPQVTNEFDGLNAMCDYIAGQLRGRFTLQFPDLADVVQEMAEQLCGPTVRDSELSIKMTLAATVEKFSLSLTRCALMGCTEEENHKFMKEFVNLVWNVRDETGDWLRGQGIVPGQSAN